MFIVDSAVVHFKYPLTDLDRARITTKPVKTLLVKALHLFTPTHCNMLWATKTS